MTPQTQALVTRITALSQALQSGVDPTTLEGKINETRAELDRALTRAQAEEEHATLAVQQIEQQLRTEFGTDDESQLQVLAEKLQTEINTAKATLASWCTQVLQALSPQSPA